MRLRFSMLDFLVLTVLCALVFALMGALYRAVEFGEFRSLTSSPDGKWCAAVYRSGRVMLWDVSGRSPRQVPCNARAMLPYASRYDQSHVYFLDDGTMIVSQALASGAIRIVRHDPATNRQIGSFVFNSASYPFDVRLSPDGNWLIDRGYRPGPVAYRIRREGSDWSVGPLVRFPSVERPGDVAMYFSRDAHAYFVPHRSYGYQSDGDEVAIEKHAPNGERVANWPIPKDHHVIHFDPDRLRAVLFHGMRQKIVIYDLATQHQLALDGDRNSDATYHRAVHFAANNHVAASGAHHSLALIDDEQFLHLYNLQTGTQVAISEVRVSSFSRVTVPREGLVVSTNDGRVGIWTAKDGVLLRRNLVAPGLGVGPWGLYAGFVGWGVVWGWVRRRRVTTSTTASLSRLVPLTQPLLLSDPRRALVRWTTLVGGLLVLFLITGTLMPTIGASSPLMAVTILLSVCAVTGVVLYLVVRNWKLESVAMRHLKRSVSAPIRLHEWGYLKAYFIGDVEVPPLLMLEKEQAQAWETWVRHPAPTPRKLLFVGIEDRNNYVQYLKRDISVPALFSPRLGGGDIVYCQDLCDLHLISRSATLRILMALLHTHLHHDSVLAPALQLMLNYRLSQGDRPGRRAASAVQRLRLQWPRGNPPTLKDFFSTTRNQYMVAAVHRNQRSCHRYQVHLHDVAATLTECLIGPHAPEVNREAFARLFREPIRVDAAAAVCHHFKYSIAELTDRWHDWVISQPAPAADLLEPELELLLSEATIPAMLDPATTDDERAVAVRAAGEFGSCLALPPLVQLLEQQVEHPKTANRLATHVQASGQDAGAAPEELGDDIVWSLQSITGLDLEADPKAWRAATGLGNQTGRPAEPRVASSTSLAPAPSTKKLVTEPPTPSHGTPVILGAENVTVLLDRWHQRTMMSLRVARVLMFLGGLWGIGCCLMLSFLAADAQLRTVSIFGIGGIWYPPRLIGVVVGAFAIAWPMTPQIQGLRLIGFLQIMALLTCDIITATLGLAVLVALPRRGVR